MGDVRYDAALDRVRSAGDHAAAIRALSDEEVIHALAAASKQLDPYYANVLATEASNRTLRNLALDERLARQNAALVELVKRIGPLGADDDAAVHAITETAAQTLQVERASVWLFTADASRIECIDLFETTLQRHDAGAQLSARDYPSYFHALEQARTIPAHDARTDPRTREFTRAYLDPLGIGAMLDAPLRLEGRLAGVVCHEDVGPPRVWTFDEQQFAASIAACVELAIESSRRARAEALLSDAGRLSASIAHAADLAGIGVGVFISSKDGFRVLYANETAARLAGRSLEELRLIDPIELVAPEDHERVREAFEQVGRKSVVLQIRAIRADGKTVPIEIGIARTIYHGQPAIIGFSRDITATADTERRLSGLVRKRTSSLDAANRELAAFVDSVAHDLRAPIRRTMQLAEALSHDYRDVLDEEGRRILGTLVAESQRTGELVRDLRELSRAAGHEIRVAPVNLTALAREVGADLQAAEPERAVELVVEHGLVARGDPGLLRVALVNLLGNAWKFTRHVEHPRVEVGSSLMADGELAFHVSDNGVGFDPDKASRIFAPFQRLHSEREYEGTGIGLATVQRIVHRHGGEVCASGEPGRGANIWFTLPGSALSTSADEAPARAPAPARSA